MIKSRHRQVDGARQVVAIQAKKPVEGCAQSSDQSHNRRCYRAEQIANQMENSWNGALNVSDGIAPER
jgi:hypothetical protein